MKTKIGHGYDVHRFAPERELWIGCVKISYEMGLMGHSDADVLTHAVIDALFGAAGLPDIGAHFPDTDDRYKGISGEKLLMLTREILTEHGITIGNVDCTVIAEQPKLKKYISDMRRAMSLALGINFDDINIKATTEEKLGFTGRLEGISAHAVCLINIK